MSEDFTGRLVIADYRPECHIGFQYLDESSYKGGAFTTVSSEVTRAILPKDRYLCANTCQGSTSTLLYFRYAGNEKYHIIGEGDYRGSILGITKGYLWAYPPGEGDENHFQLEVNGSPLTLSQMNADVIENIRVTCKDGGLELHKKKTIPNSYNQGQWAAYIATNNGDAGIIGARFKLQIERRL